MRVARKKIKMTRNNILLGSDKNALVALIAINLVVFVFFSMMYMIFGNDAQTHQSDYADLLSQFALPASGFWYKPWTLLTYFVSQQGILTLLSNMIWLGSFGYLLQTLVGNKYVIPSYVYGGLVGGTVFIITHLIAGKGGGTILSPTLAILAVSATTIAVAPNYRVFTQLNGGIPIWILFVIFLLVDTLGLLYQNKLMLPAHAAAAGIGYAYGKSINTGNNWGEWMQWLYNQLVGNYNTKKTALANKQFYKNKIVPFDRKTTVNQLNVDKILDKINSQGIDSLTTEEKNVLSKAKDLL